MAVRVRFCCHFTLDLLIWAREPSSLPTGGRDRKFANWWAVSDIHFLLMETVPEQAGLQNGRVQFGCGCSGFGFSCRGMPVGYWHALIGTFRLSNNFIQTQKARLFTSLPTHSDPSHPVSVSRKLEKRSNISNFLFKTDHSPRWAKISQWRKWALNQREEQLVCLSYCSTN